MSTYLHPLITFLLFFVCTLLLFRHWQINRQVAKVSARLEEIRQGDINQRIRIPTTRKSMNQLGASINRLIGDFQQNIEKLHLLESERKKMIAHLSHDLRTPLTAILGYVEMMQHDQTLAEATREKYLQIISAKGMKLETLISHFFELAKLETDDTPLPLAKVDMIDKIQEALLSFYHSFQLLQITPQLHYPEHPVFVLGHAQSMERILNNLLSNSLRYGASGGVIGVHVREEKDTVWVDVWDQGRGISEEEMPHIFERLYTGQAARNATQQGNGLGLPIVKKLVEKQNGTIVVTSVKNEKTTFSFSLSKSNEPSENVRET
ncbi:sensor histidine kinase [Brevibacillus sp. 179-C 1.1 NHS]|uniref:sensor histidine kinase n=1 Tax=Brevibacillus sp. 179-C 1.1 NHS TaxID=3235177 RepID=UPI00399FA7B7